MSRSVDDSPTELASAAATQGEPRGRWTYELERRIAAMGPEGLAEMERWCARVRELIDRSHSEVVLAGAPTPVADPGEGAFWHQVGEIARRDRERYEEMLLRGC